MDRATGDEIAEIRAFLLQHAPTAMFPLSNLARHGTDGTHPRTVAFWIYRDGGIIKDVLTISREGMVFPQIESGNWAAAATVLRGRRIKGLIGDATQVDALRRAAGLQPPDGLDMHEPHYHLPLRGIEMPDCTEHKLIALGDAPADVAHDWRAAFCVETLDFPPETAAIKAAEDVAAFVAMDTHRILLHKDVPVSMTGFNANLPQVVQVGGVYTPPEYRGRGYARRAVAMHLAEAAQNGVTDAVLSAATPQAARAYEAVGFGQIGSFAFCIWSEPQVAHG